MAKTIDKHLFCLYNIKHKEQMFGTDVWNLNSSYWAITEEKEYEEVKS